MHRISRSLLTAFPIAAQFAFFSGESHAHALWIIPGDGGYKVQYGEPGEGLLEKKDKLEALGPIQVRDDSGKAVPGVLREDHVSVAMRRGGVTASAGEAPLYGEGEHAGRPIWHARFIADLGQKTAPTPGAALEILPDGADGLSFSVLKGGKPLGGEGVTLISPTGWSKSFKSDAQGKLRIETPWPGLYLLEVGVEEKKPGALKGKPYAKVYNAFTLSFVKE